MSSIKRLLAVLLMLALVGAACSGGDDDDDASDSSSDESDSSDDTSDEGNEDEDDGSGDLSGDDEAAVQAAQDWIAETIDLPDDMRSSLSVAGVERSGGVAHVSFDQVFEDHRVIGANLIVHVLDDGTIQGASNQLTEAHAPDSMEMSIDEATAIDNAEKAVEGEISSSEAEAVWIQNGMDLVAAWRVQIHTSDPVADWIITLDAESGAVIDAVQEEGGRTTVAEGLVSRIEASATRAAAKLAAQRGDSCELPDAPSACIFLVDPIYASGDGNIDANDANDFLTGVELEGLDDGGDGYLIGEFANVGPDYNAERNLVQEDDSTWGAGRGQPGFEAQNVYYWIDYGQRTVQRLGFDDVLNRSFPVTAIDPQTLDNAFYSPAEQRIYMGAGTTGGGINEGEDASGVLHEYGHALLDAVNDNLLGGGDTGAYHEGFGDIFAYLTTLEYRNGDAECFFIWTDQQCLRRMDTDKVYPDDAVQEVHTDGEIYTGAIYDILSVLLDAEGVDIEDCAGSDVCNEVRDRVLTTVLASNYYILPDYTLPDIASSYLLANEAQYADADRELIEGAFADHGLTGGSGVVVDPGGNTTGSTAVAAIDLAITHTYRGDLSVLLGVADAEGNDLCEPEVLFTPDDSDAEDNLTGFLDISESPCAEFLPPSPDQLWYLFVEDTLAEDEGEIVGFTVFADGVPYPASGLPLPIADADPTGTFAVVDGSTGGGANPVAGGGLGTADGSAPYITTAITHTYQGDLSIRAGVADADDNIVCSVQVLDTVPGDSTSGTLSGDIDMADCAQFYPPSPEQRWFLLVADNAEIDEGTVDQFTLTGPDGTVFDFLDVPVVIPDADVDGVALLLDGSTGSQGVAGGGGQGSDLPLPAASVAITHTYAGDLLVTGGVIDADGRVVCEVTLHSPDSTDSSQDLVGDSSLSDCAQYYPPTLEQQWFLFVADTLEIDEGTVDGFSLTGPDGIVYSSPESGVAIPDADPTGVLLILDGDEATAGVSVPTVSVVISHPYVGDLEAYVGVVDQASGEILCETQIAEPDIDNNGVDLLLDIELPDCAGFYPPSPNQQWYVSAFDHFGADIGTIDAFVLQGPDGAVYSHPDVPVEIPDEDIENGVGLFFDGSQAPVVISNTGSGVMGGGTSGEPIVSLDIAHTYVGDLDVFVGVYDPAADEVVCEVQLAAADSSFDGDNLVGDFAIPECTAFFPPSPTQPWFVLAVDGAELDEGTINLFQVTGADGSIYVSSESGTVIPDADLDGAAIFIEG